MDIYSNRSLSFGFVYAFSCGATWYYLDMQGVLSAVSKIFSGDNGNATTILIALIGGIISLPVVGRSLEFVSSFIAEILRGRVDSFPKMVERGREAGVNMSLDESFDPKGVYHFIYYSECDPKLRDWGHRRRNRMYASITNALAALLGVLSVSVIFKSFSALIFSICIAYIIINLRVFFLELKYHDGMIETWWMKRANEVDRREARTINVNVNTSQVED